MYEIVFFVYIVDKPGKYNHQVQYRSDTVFVQNAAAEFAGYHTWAYMHTLLQQYNMQRNLPMTPLASCIELPIMRLIFNQNEAVNTQLYHVKAPLWTIIILPPNEFAWHERRFFKSMSNTMFVDGQAYEILLYPQTCHFAARWHTMYPKIIK